MEFANTTLTQIHASKDYDDFCTEYEFCQNCPLDGSVNGCRSAYAMAKDEARNKMETESKKDYDDFCTDQEKRNKMENEQKFHVGDIVEDHGCRGVVNRIDIDSDLYVLAVKFHTLNTKLGCIYYMADGRKESWHKNPSLKLVTEKISGTDRDCKFQEGDIVEAFGCTGKVVRKFYTDQHDVVEVEFENGHTVHTFSQDGMAKTFHTEPELKFISRPKKKVKKTFYFVSGAVHVCGGDNPRTCSLLYSDKEYIKLPRLSGLMDRQEHSVEIEVEE